MVEPIRVRMQNAACPAVYGVNYGLHKILSGFKTPPKVDPKKIKRILMIELTVIGDMLVATPSIRALAKMFPHAKVDVMIKRKFKQVYDCNPHINELICVDEEPDLSTDNFQPLLQQIEKNKYDLGVIMHFGTFSTSMLLKKAQIPIRAGCAYAGIIPPKGYFLTHKAKPYKHNKSVILLDLDVLTAIGDPYEALKGDHSPEMHYPKATEKWVDTFLKDNKLNPAKKIIAIHPGTRHGSHEWFNDRFVEVAEWLHKKHDAQIVFTGDGYDFEHFVTPIQKELKKKKCKSVYAKTNLHQLQAFLRRCDLLVSVDTSMVHIGACAKVPVLGLYGSGKPAIWRPWGAQNRVIFNEHVACTGCRKTHCNRPDYICMSSITVDQVKKELTAMLSKIKK